MVVIYIVYRIQSFIFFFSISVMSVMNFQPSFRDVKPPEKGSFPLDHEGNQLTFFILDPVIFTSEELFEAE